MPAKHTKILPCPFCGDNRIAFGGSDDLIYCIACQATIVGEGVFAKWNRRADINESGQTDVQQLKPKMPSFVEVVQAFDMQVYGNHVSSDESHAIKFVYEYIARHFGH